MENQNKFFNDLPIAFKLTLLPIGILFLCVLFTWFFLPSSMLEATIRQGISDAEERANVFKELRSYYTEKIVSKALAKGLKADSTYHANEDAIPLPITMINELSDRTSTGQGMRMKVYSDYPFPTRAQRELDDFARGALAFFRDKPNGNYHKIEEMNGAKTVRVAIPDPLAKQTCVDCHNTHKDSPKKDWKLGEVRGILEVDVPIQDSLVATQTLTTKLISLLSGGIIIGALSLIGVSARFKKRLSEISTGLDQVSEGNLKIQLPIISKDEIGQLAGFFNATIQKMEATESEKKSEREYLHKVRAMVDNAPTSIMYADNSLTIAYMNKESYKLIKLVESHLPCATDEIVGKSIGLFHSSPDRVRQVLGNPRNLPHTFHIEKGTVTLEALVSSVVNADGTPLGFMVFWSDVSEKKTNELRVKEVLERERKAAADLQHHVNLLLNTVQVAGQGDLTAKVPFSGTDEIGLMATGFQKFLDDLREVLRSVIEAINQQTEGSRVISENCLDMSQRAQTQFSSIEQITAAMEDLTRRVNQIVTDTQAARHQGEDAARFALIGNDTVQKAILAMLEIEKSSEKITEIIEVIEEIASQTDLLALNAAIEAARAGEHGLGFAVVADEVRKLAVRSSHAAKEITGLIKESIRKVSEGANLSKQAGDAITNIVNKVQGTAENIGRISSASESQATSTKQMMEALQHFHKTVEANGVSSEELAASAEELGAQAASLQEKVTRFRVG